MPHKEDHDHVLIGTVVERDIFTRDFGEAIVLTVTAATTVSIAAPRAGSSGGCLRACRRPRVRLAEPQVGDKLGVTVKGFVEVKPGARNGTKFPLWRFVVMRAPENQQSGTLADPTALPLVPPNTYPDGEYQQIPVGDATDNDELPF